MLVGDDPAARRALAQAWYDEALEQLQRGAIDDGRSRLIDAVELSPDFAPARDALAVLFLAEGRIDEALTQLEWAIHADPEQSLYHYHQALAHIAAGETGFATPALNRALELAPDSIAIRRTLLDVYMILGRWDRAERLLVELRDAGSTDPTLQYVDGVISFAKERLEDAERQLRNAARTLKDDPAPYAALGLLYQITGKFDLAEKSYKQALKLDNRDPYIYLVLADLYHQTGKLSAADRFLRRTAAATPLASRLPQPELARVYAQIADVAYQTGKYRTSQVYQKRAMQMLPALQKTTITPDAAAHFALGTVAFEREDVDRAINEFKIAVRANADFALAWARLADAMLLKAGLSSLDARKKLLTNARKAARKAQEAAPKHALGYYVEGRVLIALADLEKGALRSGTLREAVFLFQQARNAQEAPKDIGIYQAMILSDLASHAEAANALSQAEAELGKSRQVALLKATALIEAGKFPEAHKAIVSAWKIAPDEPALGELMSLVLFKMGDIETSLAALNWTPESKTPLPGIDFEPPEPESESADKKSGS
ncbi:MAG: tetratricopeptide repeat protein [Candidatus Dadabacteria bacterium]|nr:MAG: tetratricopeptide repeat protein [Candidatus Dadabacteria bacterium]